MVDRKTTITGTFIALVSLSIFGMLSPGCSSGNVVCGDGTVERDGYCVLELECGEGAVARDGECVSVGFACVPQCGDEVVCGDDGCGGSCGECSEEAPFCLAGECVAECTPRCDGRSCGGDGCGGSCGECSDGTSCASATGLCVPSEWTCSPSDFNDGSFCDCECGTADPDCATEGASVRGCEMILATCNASNECVGGFDPAEWICPPETLADGGRCNCGCGIPDPDCQDAANTVIGCVSGICNEDGTCAECTPSCDGNACGDDGCGGSCGECESVDAPFCREGQCVAECVPDCEGKTCSDDGCNGVCGMCDSGLTCQFGACSPPPPSLSCDGFCGERAPGGCSCAASCREAGDCCGDVLEQCGCQPDCQGKTCGDDGCGGTCGSCLDGELCDDAQQCVDDLCEPDPCNGNGTCDPTDGSCSCLPKYSGVACDECGAGRVGYPNCTESMCDGLSCNGNGTCDPVDGSCECLDGFAGADCDQCAPGKGTYPNCMP